MINVQFNKKTGKKSLIIHNYVQKYSCKYEEDKK